MFICTSACLCVYVTIAIKLCFNFFTVFHQGYTVVVEPTVLVFICLLCPHWIIFSLCLCVVTVWPIHIIVNVLNSKAGSGVSPPLPHWKLLCSSECLCSTRAYMFTTWKHCILLHGQDLVPNLPHSARRPPPLTTAVAFKRLFFSFLPLRSSSASGGLGWEDLVLCVCPPTSPPAVFYSCLVLWCVCSCQYLCLLWIACFSPWLDTRRGSQKPPSLEPLCGQNC